MFLPVRFSPRSPLFDVRREIDRVFDAFADFPLANNFAAFPPVNVFEDGERLAVEAELPGMKMDDLEILVTGNELTIKGKREQPAGDATYHRRERVTGEFIRVLTLPSDVDAERVEATLRDGVLSITLPKAAASRARKITVKSS
ncbi:MAG: Hsp20/alpha crystallin family protein [Phycisphaerae bacterium]